jgi:hypothetical protein
MMDGYGFVSLAILLIIAFLGCSPGDSKEYLKGAITYLAVKRTPSLNFGNGAIIVWGKFPHYITPW